MKILTIKILSATKHRWYFHLIEKEIEVVHDHRQKLFGEEMPCYRLFTDKQPIRYIDIIDAQIIRERDATNQELYSGKVHLPFPKGRNGVGK
jgi:hypothetical protein